MDWLDWLVVGGYALAMIAIGAYYERRTQTPEEYLLGGRRMSPFTVGLSLFATLVSTLSYLGVPGEVFAHGPMMLAQFAAYPLIMLIVGYALIPHLMRQRVTSAYEILEIHLGKSVRFAGAGVFLTLRLLWMSTILYATSLEVLVPMFNLDPRLTPFLCIGLGVATICYAAAGGLRAVVMTDALQSLTMVAGAVIVLIAISSQIGLAGWWPTSWPGTWDTPSWGFDTAARFPFAMTVLSTGLWYVCTNGSDQMSIQRYLATRDASAARKTLGVSLLADTVVLGLLALTGIALLGYYTQFPPTATSADRMFPLYILTQLPSGLAGLVIVAILAAAMSSLSSGVNSTCAVLVEDVLPRREKEIGNERQAVTRMRRLSWSVGGASIVLSVLNSFIEGNIMERCFKVVNLLTAPLFVLFFLALFVPRANAIGAWAGLLASIAAAVDVAYGKLFLDVAFVWILPVSLSVGIVVGSLVSWVTWKADG